MVREVCHLWNLLAKDTREGDVYIQLLRKLETARESLGDKVFDVLGQLFTGKSLRELLIDAVRYNADPEVKKQLERINKTITSEHLKELIERRALVKQDMDTTKVIDLKQQMERAMARRIQPHYVHDFFIEAFGQLGGKAFAREEGRYEITYIPPLLLDKDQQIGRGIPLQPKYERICFEKEHVGESPRAELVSPGHPLLEACISLISEREGHVLNQGTILVDENDLGSEPRILFCLEHGIQDGRTNIRSTTIDFNRLQFLEIDKSNNITIAGSAPYLDYRTLTDEEKNLTSTVLSEEWLSQDWDQLVISKAMQTLVPQHLKEIKLERLERIEKAQNEIQTRMQFQINHWSRRFEELRHQEAANKKVRLPAQVARERAELLVSRLGKRMTALKAEKQISARVPILKGGALIIPVGMLNQLKGKAINPRMDAEEKKKIELLAMEAVFAAEREIGRQPKDVSDQRGIGYDIESKDSEGNLFFIEVKGRIKGADSVTLTYNELKRGRNSPERFRLAISIISDGEAS